MDVGAMLVADGEASEAGEPGERALDHPAVAAEAIGAFDAPARDARGDGPLAALGAAAAVVVGLVRVELAGPTAGPAQAAAHARHDVQHGREQLAVVAVGPARASKPSGVPRASTTRWRLRSPGGPGRWGSGRSWCPATSAPFCRDRGAVDRRPVPVERVGRGQPLAQHPVQLAQHAGGMPVAQPPPAQPAPDPDPGSCRCSRTPPGAAAPRKCRTTSTKMMPSRARRSSQRGRPPFGFGGSSGSSGPTVAHSSSLTRGLVMTPNAPARVLVGALRASNRQENPSLRGNQPEIVSGGSFVVVAGAVGGGCRRDDSLIL